MKTDIIAGLFDSVVVFKIDRIFRKVTLLLEFIDFLKKYKVNFVSKSEMIDLSSSSGKFTLTLLGAVAEMERETIRERTMEGRISKALLGYFVYGNNIVYGYKKVHDGRGNKLEINKVEAKIVKKIFDMYLNEGKGTGEIARYLTSLGIGTNVDNRETPTKEKNHKNLFRQTWIVKVLRNEIYIGKYYVNRTETKKGTDGKLYKIEKDEDEWILIKTPAIIDEKTFDKVQEKLDGAMIYSGLNGGNRHMFTGKVKCFYCNHTFNYYASKKKTGNYRCGGKKKDKVSKDMLCHNHDISEDKLFTLIWPKIEEFLNNPEKLVKTYNEEYFTYKLKDKINAFTKEHEEISQMVTKKELYIKEAIKKRLENKALKKQFDEAINDYSNDIQALEKRKIDIQKQIKGIADINETYRVILKLAEKYRNEINDFKDIDRQDFIDKLLDSVIIKKESVIVRYRFERDF